MSASNATHNRRFDFALLLVCPRTTLAQALALVVNTATRTTLAASISTLSVDVRMAARVDNTRR
eukprot:10365900-Alexandrium_andersonii.AAC.1